MIDAPHGDTVAFILCGNPDCGDVHAIVMDVRGKGLAQFTIPPEEIPRIIKILQNHAYAVAAQKDES